MTARCHGPSKADVQRRNDELERENRELRVLAMAERQRADLLHQSVHALIKSASAAADLFSIARPTCALLAFDDDVPF